MTNSKAKLHNDHLNHLLDGRGGAEKVVGTAIFVLRPSAKRKGPAARRFMARLKPCPSGS